jgi:hypothetical protein
VVVIGNYTNDAVTFSVAEPEAKAREHKLPSNHVAPVYVTGPASITFTTKGKATTFHLDPYNAYVFLPDDKTGLRFEGLEMPGTDLERDTRPELNPVPRDPPVKIPVTLYVDDVELRAEKLWQKELRARFDGPPRRSRRRRVSAWRSPGSTHGSRTRTRRTRPNCSRVSRTR